MRASRAPPTNGTAITTTARSAGLAAYASDMSEFIRSAFCKVVLRSRSFIAHLRLGARLQRLRAHRCQTLVPACQTRRLPPSVRLVPLHGVQMLGVRSGHVKD